ncbi:hypothetical protein [Marinimicrobium locisalis]|uniref:hypothetical protein n=1 Tax=Marinimicrobium locisalis TaxID=546022 RepID=UPI003221AD97
MKLNLDRTIIFWGALDLAYVVWMIGLAIYHGNVPYYTNFVSDLDAAKSFGAAYPATLTVVGHLMKASVIVSAILMLVRMKSGVYLSLAQAPFRFFLIIPPSAFFVMSLKQFVPALYIVLLSAVIAVEITKVYTQIRWLRKR